MKIKFGYNPSKSLRVNQCGACHRVFGGMGGFEKHRVEFRCHDPESIGLRVSTTRSFQTANGPLDFQVWSLPTPGVWLATEGEATSSCDSEELIPT
jgi:hypothetical protein